jgi:hypothetical protein
LGYGRQDAGCHQRQWQQPEEEAKRGCAGKQHALPTGVPRDQGQRQSKQRLVLSPLLVAVGGRVRSGAPPGNPSVDGTYVGIWRQAVVG